MNKKGAEMTIGTIIVIILALIVLVVVIYGFSVGWGNLWNKILNFGGNVVNVQTVIDSCNIACATQSKYDYCILKRNVVFGDKDLDKKIKEEGKKFSCDELAKDYSSKGFVKCENIVCE